MKAIRKAFGLIGAAILFILDVAAFVCLGVLFGITFIGVQLASWTGRRS